MKISEIQIKYKNSNTCNSSINNSSQAYKVFLSYWNLDLIQCQEEMKVLFLNRANNCIGIYPISRGGISGTIVDIKLVMAVALKSLASNIILAHNHPSSNLEPSFQDKKITNKFNNACKFFDITLLDHLILTKQNYYSFADNNIL